MAGPTDNNERLQEKRFEIRTSMRPFSAKILAPPFTVSADGVLVPGRRNCIKSLVSSLLMMLNEELLALRKLTILVMSAAVNALPESDVELGGLQNACNAAADPAFDAMLRSLAALIIASTAYVNAS